MIKFKTTEEVSDEIHLLVIRNNMTYIEAVQHYFDVMGLDLTKDKHKKLLSDVVLENLLEDAIELHFMKRR